MFAKMARIKPEEVPQDHALWDDAMWELLAWLRSGLPTTSTIQVFQEKLFAIQKNLNTTCKFAELISILKLEAHFKKFQKKGAKLSSI